MIRFRSSIRVTLAVWRNPPSPDQVNWYAQTRVYVRCTATYVSNICVDIASEAHTHEIYSTIFCTESVRHLDGYARLFRRPSNDWTDSMNAGGVLG